VSDLKRREFIGGAAASLLALSRLNVGLKKIRGTNMSDSIPYRSLGSTGEKVSCIGLGGFHLGQSHLQEADAINLFHAAVDRGINFSDNSWDYNQGESERRVGKALKGYRDRVFVMTKFDGRTKGSALKQLDESLQRLQVDHVDLWQFHENIRLEDPDRFFANGGAAEANFRFDTVQMPLNVMDAHFRSFEKNVVPVLVSKQIAVLGMKSMGDSHILASKTVTPLECLQYALSLPTSVVITGIDSMQILDQAFKAANSYDKLTKADTAAILNKTAPVAMDGKYEPFKTSPIFDSTAAHPEWLGYNPQT
jgi:hypothetical protein